MVGFPGCCSFFPLSSLTSSPISLPSWFGLLARLCTCISFLSISFRNPAAAIGPYGVFATIIRIASRWFRRTYGLKWQASQPSWTHWGIADHSVEECVWKVSALLEWSRASGRSSAAFFLDVAKAFENIDHSEGFGALQTARLVASRLMITV